MHTLQKLDAFHTRTLLDKIWRHKTLLGGIKLIDCMHINCNFYYEIVRNKWY